MRKYTLLCSIVAHAAIVAAAFVVPIVATDALPNLRRSTQFVIVAPEVPPVRPPAAAPVRKQMMSPDAAPIVEPGDITPEPPRPVFAADDGPPLADGFAGLPGLGDVVVPGDGPPPPPVQPRQEQPVRVGLGLKPPQRVHYVAPAYPPIARDARKEGVVILEAIIAADGAVRDVKVLRSIPLLDQAAVDAVRQWRFSPTILNGQAIPVVMTVTVNFALH